jgi:SAM-dependent methyltransferase
MERRVEPELLDDLPPTDPLAVESRKDLERVNALMGNDRIIARELRSTFGQRLPERIIEVGAGDGRFLLRVARRLSSEWKAVSAELLDRQKLVTTRTQKALAALGWRVETLQMDVFDWLRGSATGRYDVIIANLFLHHFSEEQLREMFSEAKERTEVFIAVEPRRAGWPLALSRMLWMIGCNAVTRHDAVISVRAGFAGGELSRLWQADGNWLLTERSAGLFSHLFVARNKSSHK